MDDQNRVINGLWIGNELSPNELLSINSYLYHGHDFELYVYDRIRNVPDGVTVKDANQIVPRSEIFTFTKGRHKNSLGMFSDVFRYKLLFEFGGWWSDLDAICIKPYDLDAAYVIMQEKQKDPQVKKICGGVLKCPIASPIMEYCYERSKELSTKVQNLQWAETGPFLLADAVKKFNLDEYVVPSNYFSPIGFYEIHKMFTSFDIEPATYSIHLFNEGWNMYNTSKNGIYPKKSLFESLKRLYSVRNNYVKLIPEFGHDIRLNGLAAGGKKIMTKLWHMYRAHREFNRNNA